MAIDDDVDECFFFSSLCGDPIPNWETIHNRKREEYVNINNNQKPKPKPRT